ncbi:MAG: TrkA C-terminal domain-containing protein [Acidimicrobiales bacterium]
MDRLVEPALGSSHLAVLPTTALGRRRPDALRSEAPAARIPYYAGDRPAPGLVVRPGPRRRSARAGTLTIPDLVRAHRDELRANLRPTGQSAAGTATFGIDALPDSPFMGRRLRDAELPAGDVATAIQRNGDVLTPTGDTVIRVGDRLSLLGRPTDINDASRRPAERMSAPDDGP